MNNWGEDDLPVVDRPRQRWPVIVVFVLFLFGGSWLYVVMQKEESLPYQVHARILWTAPLDGSKASSPRLADFNGDGVLDVVVGGGDFGKHGHLTALDGRNGEQMWLRDAKDEVVSTTPLVDMNRDGTPDVFLSGRKLIRNVLALNGKNGATLWGLREANPEDRFPKINFLNILPIDDQDGDQLSDVIVIQCGGADELRIPAQYYIVSAATGEILRKHTLPDNRESYAMPILHQDQDETYLFVGTGGEMLPGQILKLKLATLEQEWGAPREAAARQTNESPEIEGKGFVASPLLTDLDGDGNLEIVAVSMNGHAYRMDADTGQVAWVNGDSEYEAYATPAAGNFDGNGALDIVAVFNHGQYPTYDSTKVVWFSGDNGKVIHEEHFDPFEYCYNSASPLVVDLNHDGRDEVIISQTENIDKFHNGLFIYDGGPERHAVLSMKFDGFSLSTPCLADVDRNGKLDLIHISDGSCRRIELTVVTSGNLTKFPDVKWGEYRGPDGTGIYMPEPK